jgi:hypothetical protein
MPITPKFQVSQAINIDTNAQFLQLTAGRAGTSVAGLQGLLVATLAEIISSSMDDDSSLDAY